MSKSLSQRNVPELEQVFKDFDIEIPAEATKKELQLVLGQHGITNKSLKAFEEKKDNKLDVNEYEGVENPVVEGDVVVRMTRINPVFGWKSYQFTTERKFVPMPKDDAFELIQAYDGFHIANREEIKRYFR